LATNAPDPADVAALAAARARVLGEIATAAARSGRSAAAISLVAVSKTVPADRLAAAVAAGLTVLGENRVQEAEAKVGVVPGAEWHLIGPLQSNKARRALETFSVIESVDSVDLAERLDRLAGEVRPRELVPVLLQVNVDGDDAKAGFDPIDLERSLEALDACTRLDVRGLMTVGRLVDDPAEARDTFVRLRRLAERLRSHWSGLGPELSMGMSGDFGMAVEEGATIVRVGRALFGERHAH
jgi:pyridoxal phosphate enzyme (YggS family)